MDQAKERILQLIQMEHTTITIKDEYIRQFTKDDIVFLEGLQKKLSIKIHLQRGLDDLEPSITLEGLTRDVYAANPEITSVCCAMAGWRERQARNVIVFHLFYFRSLIEKKQRGENQRRRAAKMSESVEWQFLDQFGQKIPFNSLDNLNLEEAFQKQDIANLKINGELYHAHVVKRRAFSPKSGKEIELFRLDKKGERGCRRPRFDQKSGKHNPIKLLHPGQLIQVTQKLLFVPSQVSCHHTGKTWEMTSSKWSIWTRARKSTLMYSRRPQTAVEV